MLPRVGVIYVLRDSQMVAGTGKETVQQRRPCRQVHARRRQPGSPCRPLTNTLGRYVAGVRNTAHCAASVSKVNPLCLMIRRSPQSCAAQEAALSPSISGLRGPGRSNMTRAVTDDHLWRRGAAEKLHYAPHSLIGRAMLGVSREVCCSAGLCAWPLQHESYLILKSWFCRSSSSGAGGGRLRKTDRSGFPIMRGKSGAPAVESKPV